MCKHARALLLGCSHRGLRRSLGDVTIVHSVSRGANRPVPTSLAETRDFATWK